jgi:hypothetical protein
MLQPCRSRAIVDHPRRRAPRRRGPRPAAASVCRYRAVWREAGWPDDARLLELVWQDRTLRLLLRRVSAPDLATGRNP